MIGLRREALSGIVVEIARRWPGSRLEAIKIGRSKITLLFRINGVRVKAIIDRRSGRIRVFSPLKGTGIAVSRLVERWIHRAEKPV